MSQQKKSAAKDLDKELGLLRDLIEKKMIQSGKKEGHKRKKS